MKWKYIEKKFKKDTMEMIHICNSVIDEYVDLGYDLTLRQLYYQLVARGYIDNNMRSYKRIGCIVNDARMAGLMDWSNISDRTRTLSGYSFVEDAEDLLHGLHWAINKDTWINSPYNIEVWVEKDALKGVIGSIAEKDRLNYFSCRGYVSQSAMYQAAQRLIENQNSGKENIIIHLGDHDPSGIDMTRDISDRLELFGAEVKVERVALNMDQIEQYNPPPNPAKITDTRSGGYIRRFGKSSWELDALKPEELESIIRGTVSKYFDVDSYDDIIAEEDRQKEILKKLYGNWSDVKSFLQGR